MVRPSKTTPEDDARPADDITAESRVRGPFAMQASPELTSVVASGGVVLGEHTGGSMGRVLRVRDKRLNRIVAVKEMLEPSPGLQPRFVREAMITARLQHPSIVSVYDA